MKKTVEAFDYAGKILKAMQKGILLTTACGDAHTVYYGKIVNAYIVE